MSDPGGRRVFITGALGFIGRALGARLRDAGAEVRGVDVKADDGLGVVAGDITRPGPWQEHARGADLVVHTAAILSLSGGDLWDVNVMGTRNALDAAVAGGARRFLHLSSVLAYSYEFPDGVDERYPVRTNGAPYVDTKVASEQVVLQAHASGEIECVLVRPGDVYGPGSRPWTIMPVEMIKARRFALPARGRGVFSPVYIETLVDGLVLAAERPEAAGEVFNLSDGAGVSTGHFFGHYARMLGRRKPPALPTTALRPIAFAVDRASRARGVPGETNTGVVAYLSRTGTYSVAKARRVLGFEPSVSLQEGMASTEAWLREQGTLA